MRGVGFGDIGSGRMAQVTDVADGHARTPPGIRGG